MILLGGGSPCQGNSVLNRTRQGLSEPRSQQPRFLDQLTADIAADPDFAHVEVVSFLENVGSMPPDVRQQYSAWMKSQPVRINAACCGWVQRNRFYWLRSRRRGLEANLRPLYIVELDTSHCEAESHLFSLNHRGCAYWALHCTTKHKSVFQPLHLGSEV